MIRLDRYVHSRRPYAVDLESFKVARHAGTYGDGPRKGSYEYWECTIRALWFRGRSKTPQACAGTLRWSLDAEPGSPRSAVAAHDDGRYGGTCRAKWDGTALWTPRAIPMAEEEVFIHRLQPMLSGFPEVPAGHDGWWTFVA